MIGVAWRMLRRQTGAVLGALIMATVGAVLVTAFLSIQTSISQSRIPVERYGGVQVAAAGAPGTIPPKLVRDLGAVAGVARAVPELSFPAAVLGRDGAPVVDPRETAVLAHGWESAALTPIELAAGSAPATGDDVVLTDALAARAGLSAGDSVQVRIGATVHTARICGIGRPGPGWTYQHGLYFSPQRAAELAARGGGRVDAVGLVLADGASRRM